MPAAPTLANRSSLLRTLTQWHWISAALALAGLALLSVTGITLNHAGLIEAEPHVVTRKAAIPAPLKAALAETAEAATGDAPLPEAARSWARETLHVALGGQTAEWSPEEIYVSLPEPGGDAWLRLSLEDGEAEYERTTRGVIAYLNDLHKGRHTGAVWSAFLDLIAIACLVFAITGLWLLKLHASNRPSTWPLAGLGLAVPLLIALLFIH